MFKTIAIGLMVALVLGLGVVGFVMAQQPEPPEEPADAGCPPCPCEGFGEGRVGPGPRGGQQPEALAEALGMTTDELGDALAEGQAVAELAGAQGVALDDIVDALVAPMVGRIEQAVEDGHLTQEEADERVETMKQHLLERLESGVDMGPGGFGGRPGPMRGDPLSEGGSGPHGGQQPEALAEVLGMATEELGDALAEGQTVAELAEAQGVALEDVVDALVEPMIERIEQAVEDGRLTQEQADEQIQTMKEHMLQQLESGFEMGRGGFGGHLGPMRGGRWGGNGPGFRLPGQTTPPIEE